MRRAAQPAGFAEIIGFVLHYGIFWFVHGVFVLSFSTFPGMGGRGEYLRTNGLRQAAAPYGRLVVLHVTIIFGGMTIAATGAPAAAAIVILVLLKTALDLGLHLAEHREPDVVVRGTAS